MLWLRIRTFRVYSIAWIAVKTKLWFLTGSIRDFAASASMEDKEDYYQILGLQVRKSTRHFVKSVYLEFVTVCCFAEIALSRYAR